MNDDEAPGRCRYGFPPPYCQCDLTSGHTGKHLCHHIREPGDPRPHSTCEAMGDMDTSGGEAVTTLLELLDASLTADEDALIQRIIDALPVCPTCDGKGWETCAEGAERCQDCRESGRMDVFRALAIARAVMDPATAQEVPCDGHVEFEWEYGWNECLKRLRAVKL